MLEKMMAQMQEQTNAIKQKLEKTEIETQIEGGLIKVVINGNRKLQDIQIDESLAGDTEALSDLLVTAVNRAIEKADAENEKEMGSMAKGMLPGLGGLLG